MSGAEAKISPQVQAKKPQVRIRTAQDLFEVLSRGNLAERLAVLSGIVAEPTRPLALGPHEGEDFVALLIRLIPDSKDILRKSLILCLMCYQDPRSQEYLGQVFAEERDAATVLHLGQRLTLDLGVDFFLPFLWGEKAAQGLAAARVCAASKELEPKERLRIALLVDGDFPAPEISQETLPYWLDELRGPHGFRATQLAEEAQGALLLWTVCEQVPDLAWLLEMTERLDPERARQETERLLESGDLFVVQAAQRLGLKLTASLLESADPDVRAAAIAAGLADSELESYLAASLPEALAAVPRCPSETLLALLGDSRWQVRSAAVAALAAGSERPLEQVRALALAESLEQGVAAVALLEQWGDLEWLGKQLPG